MRHTLFALLLAVAASALPEPSAAQAQSFPSVSIMLKSTKEFEADLKYIVRGAGPQGVAQWANIEAILPAFLGGIDPEKPIRVDLVFINGVMEIRFVIPVEDEKALVANIGGFAGDDRPRRLKTGYYRVKGAAFEGTIRIIKGYAIISSNSKLVPAAFKDPLGPIQPLIDADYDLGAIVKNTADGEKDRRDAIQNLRKEIIGSLENMDGETDSEFEIRKLSLEQQLDELERLFAESEQLMLGWTTDVPKKEGRLALELTALPNTDLEKSIADLAAKPSLFRAIDRGKNTIFFGRINHSLDPMRQKNLTAMLKLLREEAQSKIKASEKVTDDERDTVAEASGLIFDMLDAGTKMGVIDGFMDIELVEEKRQVTGGIKVDDSAVAKKVLEALVKTKAEVELDAVETENFSIHKVKFSDECGKKLKDLAGVSEVLVAIIDENTLLYAGGGNAQERIEATAKAITAQNQPANDGTFLETWVKAKPWVEILRDRRARIEKAEGFDESKLDDKEKKARKEDIELRSDALEMFAAGNDTIHMKLQQKDKKVTGVTTFAEDLLRFVGLQIAKFSEKNLQ